MAHSFRSLMLVLGLLAGTVHADETLVVASTTSTEQSGLFGWILPRFEQSTAIKVRVVAVGTGQALDIGRRGDADVLFVHDRAAEDKFVAEGYGSYRKDVMYNDFVFVGPKDDPAKITRRRQRAQCAEGDRRQRPALHLARRQERHACRRTAPVEGSRDRSEGLAGYKETGSGMGPTLNMAAATNAYTLSDRATWCAFKNRRDLDLVFAGDPVLFNPYGVIPVNPARHPHVKKEAAERFAQWLVSKEGQEAIAAFRADGQQVFFPNAKK